MVEVIDSSNLNEVRKKIDDLYRNNKKVIVIAKDDDFNRKILENKKVDLVIGFEDINRKNKLKQRNSGLNQVLCKLAKQNNIEIGIDFSDINKLNDFELSDYISKLRQNIRLCKKYKVRVIVVNFNKNKQDLRAFLLTLNMDTSMAKNALK